VLGFDLASNEQMKEALEMSWYRGVPIATPNAHFKEEVTSPNQQEGTTTKWLFEAV
jgi:hypothetical protein